VKYHFKTVQGIESFTDGDAKAMTVEDPDFHRRDLHDTIAAGNAPEWRLEMQVMAFAEAAEYRFNPFDLTKVWPHGDYPPIPVGKMVLNENPVNFFAEVEQAGFSPANRMLMGRVFSYHDMRLHRIGPNYEQLPINAPKVEVYSYNKDAAMTYRHAGSQPVYAPIHTAVHKQAPRKQGLLRGMSPPVNLGVTPSSDTLKTTTSARWELSSETSWITPTEPTSWATSSATSVITSQRRCKSG
jgi:catalase